MKILVIDDSRTFRRIALGELAPAGYEVLEAEDGSKGLEVLRENEVSLVLLDVNMPGMNGYEVCTAIREDGTLGPNGSPLPVVLITSNNSLESKLMGFQVGATDYIPKRFTSGSLAECVDRILRPVKKLEGLGALVVDDSSVSRRMVSFILKKQGMIVFEAVDGQVGFEVLLANQNDIHVVITDLEMPVMDGETFCRKIRKIGELEKLPVIFLTAHSDRQLLLHLFDAGGTDYLVKPFEKGELLARLNISLEMMSTLKAEIAERERAEKVLEETREIASNSARLAGKAELATSVLHNVGNILNSVNVSTDQLRRILKDSRISQLMKANELLDQNVEDLADFLVNNPRGKILPRYLLKTGTLLSQEFEKLKEEVFELEKKVGLMRELIGAQQNLAKTTESLLESLDLESMIDEAVYLQHESFRGIEVHKDYQADRLVLGKRSELTHILINLLKNAREAMSDVDHRKINLMTRDLDDNTVQLSIADTGCGIDPTNLAKMFSHGFTTKQTGHGFGLHYCSRAMKDIGGHILVSSEGPGRGTCFTLVFQAAEPEPLP